jgi:release factor glutamine methyltransferase
MTYKTLIDTLESFVEAHDKSTFVVKYVVKELSLLSATELYIHMNETVRDDVIHHIQSVIHTYVNEHVPIDYLLGYRYFYGHKFFVNEHVLIPRNETEELVEYILMHTDRFDQPLKVLDLGTGSGCIGLTLKKENPKLHVILSDISPKALDLVSKNAENLEINVKMIQSDWFSNIDGIFDIIVSNPPYIPDDEHVGDTVHNEPNLALYGGDSGLIHYEHILKQIHHHMHDKTLIAFEHGYQQKEALHQLIHKYLDGVHVVTKKDMQGRDRMTFITHQSQPFQG